MTIENVNIGALGKAEYQATNRRVKGFSPLIVESALQYSEYVHAEVLPVFKGEARVADVDSVVGPTRIIDRTIVADDVLILGQELEDTGLKVEALVRLGDRWEGYSWAMLGRNFDGRTLSSETLNAIRDLAGKASQIQYQEPNPVPEGFKIDIVKEGSGLSEDDLDTLARIFDQSFDSYITELNNPEGVRKWEEDESTYPLVMRNPEGQIVVVTNGDLGEIIIKGRTFRFLEIGDSASNPAYRNMGLNRLLKRTLISRAKQLGFDSIHAETRAAWGAPNFGNAKNGMTFCGTLPMNCVISGAEDIPETQDSQLDEAHRKFGSLNVWSITPANPNWRNY